MLKLPFVSFVKRINHISFQNVLFLFSLTRAVKFPIALCQIIMGYILIILSTLCSRLVAEELAKFHEASRGKELYVDKSCGPGDLNWGNPMTRKCIQNLKEFVAKGEHSDV